MMIQELKAAVLMILQMTMKSMGNRKLVPKSESLKRLSKINARKRNLRKNKLHPLKKSSPIYLNLSDLTEVGSKNINLLVIDASHRRGKMVTNS